MRPPTHKWRQQLQDARDARLRQAPSTAVDEALARALGSAVRVDVEGDALAAALASVLGVDRRLERLHRALEPRFSPRASHHAAAAAAKQALLRPLADPHAAAPFFEAYEALICRVVAPHTLARVAAAHGALEGEPLYYAAVPTIRVQQPSELPTIRPHCDGMYGLQAGSLNWWVPLTRVEATSSLHVESAPGREDFAPLLPTFGEAVVFDGRRCLHYTLPNRSARTRVSLDFRVVPGRWFEPANRLARRGYYAVAAPCATAGAGGSRTTYAIAAAGRVSALHGMPHAAPPVEAEPQLLQRWASEPPRLGRPAARPAAQALVRPPHGSDGVCEARAPVGP